MRIKITILLVGLLTLTGCGAKSLLGSNLKAPKDNILKSELVIDENGNKFIKYNYISDKELLKFSDKEDISKRTYNSFTENTGKKIKDKEVLRTTFLSGSPFLKTNGKWYQVETATTTEKEFDKITLIDKLKGLLGESAYADTTTTYPGVTSLDGYTAKTGTATNTWSGLRGGNGTAATSTVESPITSVLTANTTSNFWRSMYRLIYNFDTSILPDDVTITSSTFGVYFDTGAYLNSWPATSTLNLTQAYTANSTTLINSDFENNVSYTTRMSTDKLISSFSAGYINFSLNADGLANISKTGLSKFAMKSNWDLDNAPPTWISGGNIRLLFYTSESGLSVTPYLTIEYTVSESLINKPSLIIFE